MKVRELGLDIMCGGSGRKQRVLDVVAQNFFLRRSLKDTSCNSTLQLNNADRQRLALYFDRNERSAALTENPDTLPTNLKAEALFVAQQAGKARLFESLKALAGSKEGLANYGNVCGV